MVNVSEAASWFLQGETLELRDNTFVKSVGRERIYRFFSKSHDCQQIKIIAAFIQRKLAEAPTPVERQEYLQLADAFVSRHGSDWYGGRIARVFDRAVVSYRPNVTFAHQENQASYQKWLRNGFSADIYHKHPQFCTFMETSGLMSQMKVTRDAVREIDGEPAVLVEGAWTKWSVLRTLFEPRASKRYGETFIVHKHTNEVYTYLDNGRGLQKHHPYVTENAPISTLNEGQYQTVLAKAQAFVRPGEEHLSDEERQRLNAGRPFVLQLVSSYTEGLNTRMHELMIKPKHPYLRVIAGADNPEQNTRRGEVYEVGYGWKKKVIIPLRTTQGQFRSPDVWEYVPVEERLVTNIPISQEEARALREYTLKYHRDGVNLGNPVAFHLTRQNCSTYVRNAMAVAGIEAPTEVDLASLIHEVSPEWMANVADFFGQIYQGAKKSLKCAISALPQGVHNALTTCADKISSLARRAMEAVTAFCMVPLNALLGGGLGEGGRAFVPPRAPESQIGPTLHSWKSWFSLSTYRINLPGVLQRWQRQQASTVVYDKPVRLAIVP